MIVTHKNPDLDCIVATWMLKKFCDMEDEEIKFIRFGEPIPSEYEGAIFVDIGGGKYNHHQREDYVSSATIILEKFDLQNDPVLNRLANVARMIDHGLFDKNTKEFQNLLDIINGLNKIYSNEPLKVMEIVFECLDAIYEQKSRLNNVKKEFNRGIKFKTKWGPGIGIKTHLREVRWYSHNKGYIVFVYVDPVTKYRGFAAPGGKEVDFSKVYEKVKSLEPEAEWYLHFSKDLLICGSDKALNKKLSNIKLEELINLVKIDE